jgi:hypothetical protein
MAWSKRRKYLLIATVLVLVAYAAIWLQPVSPIRDAYNQIRVGMNVVQFTEVLERCGWGKYRPPTGSSSFCHLREYSLRWAGMLAGHFLVTP